MNRKLKTFLLISPLALLITACNGSNPPSPTTYEMVFDGKNCSANNKEKYEKDAKVEFTIEPDSGYTLPEKKDVKVTGVTTFDYVLSSDKATFTCTMPSNKVTVAVTANPDSPTPTTYTLTLTLNNCNVDGDSTYSKTYEAGATIEDVTVSPDTDYVLNEDSIEDGYEEYWEASTGENYVLSGLTMDASYTIAITASSVTPPEPTKYALEVNCTNCTPSGNLSTYAAGADVLFTITPAQDFELPIKEDITVTGVTNYEYTITLGVATFSCTMPANTVTVTVTASSVDPETYTISTSVTGVSFDPEIMTEGEEYSGDITLSSENKILPEELDSIILDGGEETDILQYCTYTRDTINKKTAALVIPASYVINNVSVSLTLEDEPEVETYTMTFNGGDGYQATNETEYEKGSHVTFAIQAKSGYLLPYDKSKINVQGTQAFEYQVTEMYNVPAYGLFTCAMTSNITVSVTPIIDPNPTQYHFQTYFSGCHSGNVKYYYKENEDVCFEIEPEDGNKLPETVEDDDIRGTDNYNYTVSPSGNYATFTCKMTNDITLWLDAEKDESARFNVTWVNYDGEVLEEDTDVIPFSEPSYDGATPTRPGPGEWTFKGWKNNYGQVDRKDSVYTADFALSDDYFLIDYSCANTSGTTPNAVTKGEKLEIIFSADEGYTLPTDALVFYGTPGKLETGVNGEYYNYNPSTGEFACTPTADTFIYVDSVSSSATKLSNDIVDFSSLEAKYTGSNEYFNQTTDFNAINYGERGLLGDYRHTSHSSGYSEVTYTPTVTYNYANSNFDGTPITEEFYEEKTTDDNNIYAYVARDDGSYRKQMVNHPFVNTTYHDILSTVMIGCVGGFDAFISSYDERTKCYSFTYEETMLTNSTYIYYVQFDSNYLISKMYAYQIQHYPEDPGYASYGVAALNQIDITYSGDQPTPPEPTVLN